MITLRPPRLQELQDLTIDENGIVPGVPTPEEAVREVVDLIAPGASPMLVGETTEGNLTFTVPDQPAGAGLPTRSDVQIFVVKNERGEFYADGYSFCTIPITSLT
jgi:hypothetical protein